MGLQFAPFNIPLERRLQTMMAAFWIFSLTFGSLICLWFAVYLSFFTSYWPLVILYMTWVYFDSETPFKGGRKMKWLRSLPLWKNFIDFFPIRLVKTSDIPADRNYLFCVYPHGILSAGIFGNFGTDCSDREKLFPGINFSNATLDMHFKTPFFRDYILSLGAVSASKKSLYYLLDPEKKGNACVLIVGGAAESLYAKPGSYRIILKKRRGFIKVALSTGCSIVPVFSFGEIDLYDQVSSTPGSRLYRFQNWFKEKSGVAFCVPKGRGLFQYSFGIVPRRSPITTVVGKPIDVPKVENPSEDQIQHYHDLFTKQLSELFEEHKKNYAADPEKTVLIIE